MNISSFPGSEFNKWALSGMELQEGGSEAFAAKNVTVAHPGLLTEESRIFSFTDTHKWVVCVTIPYFLFHFHRKDMNLKISFVLCLKLFFLLNFPVSTYSKICLQGYWRDETKWGQWNGMASYLSYGEQMFERLCLNCQALLLLKINNAKWQVSFEAVGYCMFPEVLSYNIV